MSKTIREKLLYILLGIGIGLVISSSLFITNSTEKVSEYSDEDIIQRAKDLGMVFIKDAVKIEEENEEENKEEKVTQTNKDEINNISLPSDNNTEYINFTIKKGESTESISKRLFEEGIIDDSDKFNTYIFSKGLEKKIFYGDYKVKKGSTYDELLQLFTPANLSN